MPHALHRHHTSCGRTSARSMHNPLLKPPPYPHVIPHRSRRVQTRDPTPPTVISCRLQRHGRPVVHDGPPGDRDRRTATRVGGLRGSLSSTFIGISFILEKIGLMRADLDASFDSWKDGVWIIVRPEGVATGYRHLGVMTCISVGYKI